MAHGVFKPRSKGRVDRDERKARLSMKLKVDKKIQGSTSVKEFQERATNR